MAARGAGGKVNSRAAVLTHICKDCGSGFRLLKAHVTSRNNKGKINIGISIQASLSTSSSGPEIRGDTNECVTHMKSL